MYILIKVSEMVKTHQISCSMSFHVDISVNIHISIINIIL